ncbi:hypothetical protein PENTCL1PPCAC_4737, partial [Pristionchus entomophagus]
ISQTTNGASVFSFTWGKFLILVNRMAVLENITNSINIWSPRKTYIWIFFQYAVPLTAHIYFVFAPVNWSIDALGIVRFTGLDDTTGLIYRCINGIFYALYAVAAIVMNFVAGIRLKKLSTSSSVFYKQQRSLFVYTLSSTASHFLFAVHQFASSYGFFAKDRQLMEILKNVRFIVFDLTIFADPIVLIFLSKPARSVVIRQI